MINYTKPSRHDDCWDIEQECFGQDEDGDYDNGPVEIFKLRREGVGKGSHHPICTIEHADMDGPKSEAGGNIALIATAPRLYESLKQAAEMLRFLVNRKQAKDKADEMTALGPKKDSIDDELFSTMADADATLRHVEWTHEQLMAGEHVS